jgi:hypothetical protein
MCIFCDHSQCMERIMRKCFKYVLVHNATVTSPLKDSRPARVYPLINKCRKSRYIGFPMSATKRFTSVVDWGEFSGSSPATGFLCVGVCVSHRSRLQATKDASPFRKSNRDSSLVQAVLQSVRWVHHWWMSVRAAIASYAVGHNSFLRKIMNKYTCSYSHNVLRKRGQRVRGNKEAEIPKNISRMLYRVLTYLPTKN